MPPSRVDPVVEFAPAKLNLDLHVTSRRADGYHELDSLVVFADLGDELTFVPADDISLEIAGPFADLLPVDADNLVLRAAHALAGAAAPPAGAHIRLDKRLPVAACIGGGSADAAATLRGLQRLWGTTLGPADLARLGLGLGADVPVCLLGRSVRMRGIGELLQPLAGSPMLDLVLVNPCRPLATAAVFKASDPGAFAPRSVVVPAQPTLDWLCTGRNDLEPAARLLLPEIDRILAALAAEPGCGVARMSGSGPTCFGAFADQATAAAAADRLVRDHPGWWVKRCRSLAAPDHGFART